MKKINNIIFIEDDEITCFLNKAIVEEMEVAENVHCLDDEEAALEYLKEQCSNRSAGADPCPELIFLDLNLPFLNAFEFLERLERMPEIEVERLFIVLLTASWDVRDMEKAKQYNIQGFLNKPLTHEKIQQVILTFNNSIYARG
ncbi:response regulator [Cesiribacter sp. SM1]|uniref:response regulator n=1 Tax=Cesiribacter sp. SM1 TaxID=2861196 RepID=UPI001CD7BB20|nr:response regulator [Cesiribacter sp. SM1]